MKKNNTLLHRIIFTVFTASLIIGNLVLVMPTASAVGVDNTFTAEFNASGDIKNLLTITFTNPICADPLCAAPVSKEVFVYTDGNSPTGFSTLSSCSHYEGSRYVVCDMGEDATAADTADSIYIKPGAIWGVDGGVVSGSENAVSLTATADTTGPTAVFYIDDDVHASNKIVVQFNEPIVDETGNTIASEDFAYVDNSGGDATTINIGLQTIMRPGSTNFVNITLNAVLAAADNVDTLATVDNKIYDIYGNELTSPVPGTAEVLVVTNAEVSENPTAAPTIVNAYAKAESGTGGVILVEFDYPVTSTSGATDALTSLAVSDLQYGATPANVDSVTSSVGNTIVIIGDDTESSLAIIDPANDTSIYDIWTNAMVAGDNQEQVDDVSNPVPVYVGINQYIDGCEEDESGATTGKGDTFGNITDGEVTSVWGHLTAEFTVTYPQEGWGMYEFASTAIYADNDGFVVDLDHDIYDDTNGLYEFTQVQFDIYYEDSDSTAPYTDGDNDIAFYIDDDNTALDDGDEVEWFIDTSLTGDLAEKTWTTITVDLDGTPDEGTLAGLASNPQYWGIKITDTPEADTLEANDAILIDNVKFIREDSSKSNVLYIEYSEWVEGGTGDPVEGAAAVASNANIGNMTTSNTIAGLGAFETGTLTTKTLTNSISKETATLQNGSVYAITLADQDGGLITQASPVTLSATFTPIATVTDKDSNTIAVGSTVEATVGAALDLTTAATAVSDFVITSVQSGALSLSWNAPSQTAATFSHYVALWSTSSGIDVADNLFDDTDDATLATATTAAVSLTGLTNGTTYYTNLVGVDTKGNATSLAIERSASPTGGSGGGGDSTDSGPAAPSSFVGSVDENLHTILTWTDPADTDLESIQVLRSKGEGVDPGTVLATVNAGTETYTDEDVSAGDIVNYQLRGKDNDGAFGTVTETLTLTIEAEAAETETIEAEAEVEAAETETIEAEEEVEEEAEAEEEVAEEEAEVEVKEEAKSEVDEVIEYLPTDTVIEKVTEHVVKPVYYYFTEEPESAPEPIIKYIEPEIMLDLIENYESQEEQPGPPAGPSVGEIISGGTPHIINEIAESIDIEEIEEFTAYTSEGTPIIITNNEELEKFIEEEAEKVGAQNLDINNDYVADVVNLRFNVSLTDKNPDKDILPTAAEFFCGTDPNIADVNDWNKPIVKSLDKTRTSDKPEIRVCSVPGDTVDMLLIKKSEKKEIFVGTTTIDDGYKGSVRVQEELSDGEYYLFAIGDSGTGVASLTVDTKEALGDLTIEVTREKLILGIIVEGVVTIASKANDFEKDQYLNLFAGEVEKSIALTAEKETIVYITIQSRIFSSVVIADANGVTQIQPSLLAELPPGTHEITAYSSDLETNRISNIISFLYTKTN